MGFDCDHFKRVHKLSRGFSATLDAKAYNAAGAVRHILFSKSMILIRLERGIFYPSDLIIRLKIFCNRKSVFAMSLHSDVQAFKAEVEKVCAHGGGGNTKVAHKLSLAGIDLSDKIFKDVREAFGGIGRVGELTEELTPAAFARLVGQALGTKVQVKEGAKAIRLADMASIVDADVYLHSHTHLPMVMKQGFYRIDHSHFTVNNVTKLFVNTSSALSYGGYGEAFEFKPNSTDTPTIYINGQRREFTAKL